MSSSKGQPPTASELIALGHELERARTTAGLSAREVADAAGISSVYLRAIERGSNPKTGKPSRPRADTLLAVSRALGLDPAGILSRAGYRDPIFESTGDILGGAPARGGIEDLLRQIQDSVKGLNRRSPFMYNRTVERLQEFTADFRAMASGTLRCTPQEEPILTRLAAQECRAHLRAVSYQDEQWWTSDIGDSYLDLHGELASRDVEMRRIFLVTPGSIAKLRPTFERHRALNIPTLILNISDVNEYYWRDFVLYDDAILRVAAPTDQESSRKTAEFTDDRARVMQALEDFHYLWRAAKTDEAALDRILTDAT
jgi:transcriptional regulator with XRE-family HTH domain